MTKARWIPDPVITEIDRGNGVTQLLTEVEPPAKEIQYFHWTWPTPKRKSNKWVYHSIAAAVIAGCVSVLLIPFFTMASVIVLSICLAWLGLVGIANAKGEEK